MAVSLLPPPRAEYLSLSNNGGYGVRRLANGANVVRLSLVFAFLFYTLHRAVSNLRLVLKVTRTVFLESLFGAFSGERGFIPLALELNLIFAKGGVWGDVFEAFVVRGGKIVGLRWRDLE